ncbi:MAG: type II secretion system F family protein [Patescibacteria group bacterium]
MINDNLNRSAAFGEEKKEKREKRDSEQEEVIPNTEPRSSGAESADKESKETKETKEASEKEKKPNTEQAPALSEDEGFQPAGSEKSKEAEKPSKTDQVFPPAESEEKQEIKPQEEVVLKSKKEKKEHVPFWKRLGKKQKKDATGAVKPKGDSPLHAFLSGVNNIGMGKQVNLFVQSSATMLTAGLPLLDVLRVFQMETRSKPMKKMVGRIIGSVENGTPFWRAMEEQHLFTPYDLAMVRIGEEAGNLARNIQYLAEQREKDRSLRQQVKMAMIYPAIVTVMMFVIVMGLGLFVLPNLVQVLYSLNVDLPLTTRVVIYVTKVFSDHGKVFVPLILVGITLFFLLAKFTRFRVVSQWLVFHIPGIGRLAREATVARFGVILGGLLQAGVPFVEALESLVDVTQVISYKNFYAQILEHVKVGDTFSKGFAKIKGSERILPVSVQQLIVAGERSGSLSQSLLQISTIYEKKASETAQALPVILEPILLLFIGALVAAIAFAIIVPIYSVVGNVGNA